MATTTEFTAKIKAFSCEKSARDHRVRVGDDGTVRVWDTVAGHFTTCHAMSVRTQGRLRNIAADEHGLGAGVEDPSVCGLTIRHDASGQGHCWRHIDRCDIPASVVAEIEGEIVDGDSDHCADYIASNGLHYQW